MFQNIHSMIYERREAGSSDKKTYYNIGKRNNLQHWKKIDIQYFFCGAKLQGTVTPEIKMS